MGRLIVSAQVTVDGVMDQLEGWFDSEDESAQHGLEQLRAADALVLGRETYEFLSEFWPRADGPYAELINPKCRRARRCTRTSNSNPRTPAVTARFPSRTTRSTT